MFSSAGASQCASHLPFRIQRTGSFKKPQQTQQRRLIQNTPNRHTAAAVTHCLHSPLRGGLSSEQRSRLPAAVSPLSRSAVERAPTRRQTSPAPPHSAMASPSTLTDLPIKVEGADAPTVNLASVDAAAAAASGAQFASFLQMQTQLAMHAAYNAQLPAMHAAFFSQAAAAAAYGAAGNERTPSKSAREHNNSSEAHAEQIHNHTRTHCMYSRVHSLYSLLCSCTVRRCRTAKMPVRNGRQSRSDAQRTSSEARISLCCTRNTPRACGDACGEQSDATEACGLSV